MKVGGKWSVTLAMDMGDQDGSEPGDDEWLPAASVAVVQDHLVQRGGGERVLLSIAKALPGAAVHTSFFWPEATFAEFGDLPVRPSLADRVPGLARHHRAALPIMPLVFSGMRVREPVVFCGTSGWAAGVRTDGRKILYFHAIARWLHERDAYMTGMGPVARAGLRALDPALRWWDRRAVESGHRWLVYSAAMGELVEKVYDRETEILPPPVVIDPDGPEEPLPGLPSGYFLCPCRLMAYKNIEILLQAFAAMPDEFLVVAGDGPDGPRLRALAPPNVRFVGAVGDAGMRWLYRNAAGVVSAAYEPFGLVTLEANAFGTRAVVLRAGGFRDTVVEGCTGVFFDELDPEAVRAAVDDLRRLPPADGLALRRHMEAWSEARFITRVREVVAEELTKAGAA